LGNLLLSEEENEHNEETYDPETTEEVANGSNGNKFEEATTVN